MADGGNSDVPLVPEFRLDVSGPETCTKNESMKVFFKPAQEPTQESAQDPAQESSQESSQEPTQESAQESAQENKFTPSEEQQDPVVIKSSGNFEVSLDTRGVHIGWYWAVFCVSLEHLGDIEDKLDSIIFDVTSKEMNTGVVYKLDYTCKTVIEKDEIRCLPRTKSTRLKLHRQIEVTADTDLCISIKAQAVSGCTEDASFDLNYFELACRHICSEDHVLWGEGKPDKFIRIGAKNAGCEKVPIAIEASDVSANGKMAVTVYFNPAISDIHIPQRNTRYNFGARFTRTPNRAKTPDGDRVSERAFTTGPGSIYTPDHGSAHTPEQGFTHNPAEVPTHGVQHPALLGPPQGAPNDSEEQNQSVVYKYKEVSRICPDLQDFFGFGAFHNTDQHDPNCENERYFNFHGSTFDVYSTNGGWKQLYSLTFGIKGVPCRPEDMNYLTQSLRGRYFAWTGDRGAVSIWDFETGTFINTILIPHDTRGVCAALCEDGSMIAITVNGCIQLHDVVSGIKLGVSKAEWKEDNGSEIIFRQDYFMALNAAESTSGNKNIDARSIFRVPDMKIVKTHHVFWQYAAEYASTLNPIFLYRQGAILNIKRLGNILCPTEDEEDNCTLDTEGDFGDA
ncbi:hypothetical protein BGZ75_000693, partial [Mortierella antarctica]